MVKRAMVAGLNSAGCHVRDLRVASPAINRLTTRDTRCMGGVHVCQSASDPQILEIHFYDKTGLDLAPFVEKKIERLYFRGEFRRAFLDEVGDIIYPPRAIEYYSAGMAHALERRQYSGRRMKVVADMGFGVASIVVPHVAHAWEIDLTVLNPFLDAERSDPVAWNHEDSESLRHAMQLMGADLGAFFEPSGERLHLVTSSGVLLDDDTALHAMVDLWCRTDYRHLPIAVPLAASSAVERIAERTGHDVVRPGRTMRSMAALALHHEIGFAGSTSGGYIFSDFLASYDAVMALGSAARMLASLEESLDDVVAGLPVFFKQYVGVFCPTHRKGAVMRAVTGASAGHKVDLTEGVRVTTDAGWVLVLPHASEPLVQIWAEADGEQTTRELLTHWKGLVETAIGTD